MPDPNESFADMTFPTRGTDVTAEYELQVPGTSPVAVNVRAFEVLTARGRGGSRAGLTKFIPATVSG